MREEGDYGKGKKIGIWKEYYENGQLKFDGEYLNGKKNGKAKEFNENGDLMENVKKEKDGVENIIYIMKMVN